MSALATASRKEAALISSRHECAWNPTFGFVGLAVELLGAPRQASWALPETVRECTSNFPEAFPPIARVHCSLRTDPYLRRTGQNHIRWCWRGEQAYVSTRGLRAHVRDLGVGSFAATARLIGDDLEIRGLLMGVSGAILEAQGGAFLHATGVEIEGGVVLFVGPSGAGKSTAADLCSGRPIFSVDKAAVFPDIEGAWWAAPLPEHVPGRLSDRRHSSRRLPLRGILRVHQGEGRSQIVSIDPLHKLLYLRESLISGDPTIEELRVNRLQEMASSVPVASVRTALGPDLTPHIRAWLAGEGK